MLIRKKVKDLTNKEIEFLYYINKTRCSYDYNNLSEEFYNNAEIPLSSFYKYRELDYEVIMGDDWYILFEDDNYLVKIAHFYALPELTNKRVVEIVYTLKSLMEEFKGKLCVALMRHDTSYKLFNALENKGYIKRIDISSIDELEDSSIDNKIRSEILENGFLDNSELYKCLYHLIFFRIGKKNDIEMQEKQDLYVYLLKNRRC